LPPIYFILFLHHHHLCKVHTNIFTKYHYQTSTL